jgi:hypothetical protein
VVSLFWIFWACSASSSQNTSGARLTHPSCTQAIIAAVLSINDKHTLSIKHANNQFIGSTDAIRPKPMGDW